MKELERLIKGFIKQMEEQEKEVRVGRVSKETAMALKKVTDDHRASHVAIKEKIEAYIEKLEAEHDCTPFNDRKLDAWERIYDELNLPQADRTKHYRINHEDGIVYLIDRSDNDEVEEEGIEVEVGIRLN